MRPLPPPGLPRAPPFSAVNAAGYGVLCTINGFWYEQTAPFITQPSPVWAATQHANNPSQPLFWWVGQLCRPWHPLRSYSVPSCLHLFHCVQDGGPRVVRSMGCGAGKKYLLVPSKVCNITLSGHHAFSLGATRLTCCMGSPDSPPMACRPTIGAFRWANKSTAMLGAC